MSQPLPRNSPDNPESRGGEYEPGEDSAMKDFYARNRAHKRTLFRKLAEGAAFETGKQVAKGQDFGDKVTRFVEWLGENLS